jgi:hypothetical protein
MVFIGNQPTAVPLTSSQLADGLITTDKLATDAVTSAKILDSTIVNADIASTTINLTQKVTGTLPLTNGGTGLATLGTAAQELRVNSSATALEYYTPTVASSDYVRLATTTITSGVTSVEITTGFSDTYKIYALYIMGLTVATNSAFLKLQFGTGGGPTYATSEYKGTDFGITGNIDSPGPTVNGGTNISDCVNLNGTNGTSSNANYNYNAVVYLNNMRSTATLYKHAYVTESY